MKSLRTSLYTLVGLVGLAGIVAVAPSVLAEQDTTSTANTIKVSPVRTDISIEPGQTDTVDITVSNPTDSDVRVSPIQNDFIAGDEDGTPALILDENEFAPSHSLKRFMQPVDDITIEANGSTTVELTIRVPADAEAGGYFGALRFAPSSPDDGGQVNLSPSVASLVLLTVPGDIEENLNLTNLDVALDGDVRNFFVNTDNMEAEVRFTNDSQVQLAPFGKLSVLKGDEIVHDVDFNIGEQPDVVLPDSARRWTVPIDNTDAFGRYTLSATFTYGSENKTVEMTKTFWVIPVWVMAVGGLAVLAVIVLIVWLVRRQTTRNARTPKTGRR